MLGTSYSQVIGDQVRNNVGGRMIANVDANGIKHNLFFNNGTNVFTQ